MTYLEEKLAKKVTAERAAYRCPPDCQWSAMTPVPRHGENWVWIGDPNAMIQVD